MEISSLFVEEPDGRVKVSLRSTPDIDVSKIAIKFGGGGHKMAAGTHIDGPIEKAMETIKTEISQQLDR